MSDIQQYGDNATKLLMESRRSTQTDTLMKYNDTLVRTVIREQRDLEKLALSIADENLRGPPPPALLIIQTSINRNKRCLLAYHAHRTSMLQNLYWKCGGALPHLLSNPEFRAKLSPHEVDYLRQYNASLMEYRSEFTYELDIMSGIEKPPKEIHVRVRVARECGVVQTENGSIDFKPGERYVVRRADVENLIVQGYLEEI
ncbi:DNA replication complex GINS protein PSF1 [Coprinopsis cinerea okayama7|uniref:DNA replication complex GINS protein PSF1 n=1 Tax=Coprinopsis cinerea (strain Okayama-7 / 130 / ATCC MYA-4618 / FGSC 9003) TaxID=240176 RepID=A8NLV2_COPC7|nr:DNA replication complex GINS protein PSF1 [Coprinopsis cinerea okayama7\|eukprot:XP_001834782.1 DNA replication complex GINS protein PSF1 [Coprinopsis cinerea okayama7\